MVRFDFVGLHSFRRALIAAKNSFVYVHAFFEKRQVQLVVACPSINVTEPVPAPAIVRLKVNSDALNVAVQLRAASIVTLVVCELPPQSLPQPANVDPLAGAADSVTSVPVS